MSTNTEKISLWDRLMMAASFAEANESEMALEMLNKQNMENRTGVQNERPRNRPEMRV